jgi:site-specific DNA-cytosine methylase
MGERVVDDERNLLTSRFADVVMAIEPSFFVMENVQGLLSIGTPPDFAEYVIREGKSIGTCATSIVRRLPSAPKARAQRDRQFRKKLVSRAITEAKVKIADIAVAHSSTVQLGAMLEGAEAAIRDEIARACKESFETDQLQEVQAALDTSGDDVVMIALGSLVEALMASSVLSTSNCEERLKSGLPSVKGRRKQVIQSLLDSFDAAPSSTDYQGVTIGPLLSRLIQRLSKKYKVAPPAVLSSAWYGAPQDRRRLFLVGIHKRCSRQFEFPLPEFDIPGKHERGTLLDLPLAPTCSAAIGDLPDIDGFDFLIDSDELPSRRLLRPSSFFQKCARMDAIEPDDLAFCREDWNPFVTDCCLRTLHEDHVLERLRGTANGEQDETSHKTRLHPDRVSHTLRAGTREKMGSHTAVRPIHYSCHRVISVREGARLMGFPDWMTFHRTKWHGFRLVGNGVPQHLGRAIARSLRAALADLVIARERGEAIAALPSDGTTSDQAAAAARYCPV